MTAVVVDLPENLTIAVVETLHQELAELAQSSNDVVLNGADVCRTDTAGLQMLYAFCKALREHEASVSWSSPSSTLMDAAELLGVRNLLALAV